MAEKEQVSCILYVTMRDMYFKEIDKYQLHQTSEKVYDKNNKEKKFLSAYYDDYDKARGMLKKNNYLRALEEKINSGKVTKKNEIEEDEERVPSYFMHDYGMRKKKVINVNKVKLTEQNDVDDKEKMRDLKSISVDDNATIIDLDEEKLTNYFIENVSEFINKNQSVGRIKIKMQIDGHGLPNRYLQDENIKLGKQNNKLVDEVAVLRVFKRVFEFIKKAYPDKEIIPELTLLHCHGASNRIEDLTGVSGSKEVNMNDLQNDQLKGSMFERIVSYFPEIKKVKASRGVSTEVSEQPIKKLTTKNKVIYRNGGKA